MIIAEINTVSVGSTGKIMFDLADTARKKGHTVYTYSAKTFRRGIHNEYLPRKGHTYFGSEIDNFFHKVFGCITGFNGCFSWFTTRKLIKQLEEKEIDILHLHNLHEFCINLPMLFKYVKKKNIRVIWTLHDCWSFTGHCPYFSMVGCDKWKSGCGNCPQKYIYPKCYLDTTKIMWKKKRAWFTGVKDMTIITPSNWLASLVKESFLCEYPVIVINNGIDLDVFKPTPSDFRITHGIMKNDYDNDKKGEFMLLGIAFGWGKRKGIDVFLELFKRLDDRYKIVLIGTDDEIDKILPKGIISIHRTNNVYELAEIYSAADLLVNPTREDNYPTVNMESIACGTPVITFNTGGSPEIIDILTGVVVPCDDIDQLVYEIDRICTNKSFSEEDCIKRAHSFDKFEKFKAYVKLYES